jgi:hypothetical protein
MAMTLYLVSASLAMEWRTVYETDFSTDPGWTTNNHARYHWVADSQTFFADTYTNNGEFATTDLDYDGESFQLTFDVKPIRNPGETGDVNVGLFGPTRVVNSVTTEERLYVMFGGYGNQVYIAGYNTGEESIFSGEGNGLMLNNAWHHAEITYHADSKLLSLEIRRGVSSVLSWQTTMNYGFSSDLSFLGVSTVGKWVTTDRHEAAYIDNVQLSVQRSAKMVAFDIKPGSCPNPLNIKDKGGSEENDPKFGQNSGGNGDPGESKAVLPTAIMGTADFDVHEVDPATIRLLGTIAPVRWSYEDVGAPADKAADACACSTVGPDGSGDLTLKFNKATVVAALGPVEDRQVIELTLTGELCDGTPIEGSDCVVIVGAGKKPIKNGPKDQQLPLEFALHQNYPNPFNPSTEIGFALPHACDVRLEVFNVLGQRVVTLVDGYLPAGEHSVTWDASRHASGVYLYRLSAGDVVETKSMILLK